MDPVSILRQFVGNYYADALATITRNGVTVSTTFPIRAMRLNENRDRILPLLPYRNKYYFLAPDDLQVGDILDIDNVRYVVLDDEGRNSGNVIYGASLDANFYYELSTAAAYNACTNILDINTSKLFIQGLVSSTTEDQSEASRIGSTLKFVLPTYFLPFKPQINDTIIFQELRYAATRIETLYYGNQFSMHTITAEG